MHRKMEVAVVVILRTLGIVYLNNDQTLGEEVVFVLFFFY